MKIGFKPSTRQIIIGAIALVLLAGTFALARYLTITMRAIAGIPGAPIIDNSNKTAGTPDAPSLPTAEPVAPAVALPPTWDGGSRVTILLMGIDTEVVVDKNGQVVPSDRTGPARSDTMILLTIDPQSKTAGMMSIPRDLWANTPGFGYARINTAYYNGEANKLPGGGPELAMRTVEQVVGVQVQYYAVMEFWAFTNLIDEIGKIDVFVDKKIIIDPMGPGADKIMLSAGWHKLGGVEALGYARQRHTEGGDVDRSKRQQAVILAVRQKVADPANFPTLLANAPAMYNQLQSGVRTNLTFDDIMRLGMLAKDIPPENIKRGVIDYTMVQLADMVVKGEKQSVFKPISDKIRVLRDDIFTASGALSPMAKGADAFDLAKQEGATIAVYNGSSVAGMAQKTADYLKSLGLNVVVADTASYQPGATQVIDHRGKLYTLRYFKELFKLGSGAQIINKYDPASAADIDIVLSDDWALSNPMP
jgi:polyisoprenyl-teichoic acid--peptidoglycan teichoic acid transferase